MCRKIEVIKIFYEKEMEINRSKVMGDCDTGCLQQIRIIFTVVYVGTLMFCPKGFNSNVTHNNQVKKLYPKCD